MYNKLFLRNKSIILRFYVIFYLSILSFSHMLILKLTILLICLFIYLFYSLLMESKDELKYKLKNANAATTTANQKIEEIKILLAVR